MTRQPFLKLYIDAHIDGKRVGRRRLSRSFVASFARLVLVQVSGASAGNQTDTGGTSRLPSFATSNLNAQAAIDVSTAGIVVGTGTTAVAVGDTKLVTQIATGNAAGQLRYLLQQFNSMTSTSTTNDFAILRSFINNSGGSITVNEIGIYINGGSSPWIFCGVRDVIGGGIAVAAGKTLTITYTFSWAI